MSRIAVLGSGAWGTAIALALCRRGLHHLTLWSHSEGVCESIRCGGENAKYLPGFAIPAEVELTADLAAAVRDAEIIVSVVPSAYVRETYEQLAPFLNERQILLSATKGIVVGRVENLGSGSTPTSTGGDDARGDAPCLRMTEVIREALSGSSNGGDGGSDTGSQTGSNRGNNRASSRGGNLRIPCGVLSGPSFAQEVAAGFPTAVTVAFADSRLAVRIQNEFSSSELRLYSSDDVVGVELGGAFKNVIAIASGMVEGLGLGYNSAAALVTRGMAEMTRLAVACGGRRETLAGLSGMGDLVLTCTGSLSRNRTVGVELGKGRPLPEVLAGLGGKVAEGVQTTAAVLGLARHHGVELPIAEQMGKILYEGKAPLAAMGTLMSRPGRGE